MHADTRRIGCGLAECSGLLHLTSGRRYILACHYSPPGNEIYVNANYAIPAFEYATAGHPVCSKCPPGTMCVNKLCRSV
uniref:SCP domain-containing protein n=1 Tax=Romanomermis culicivorax TaxID=13658 RepID=A0A915HJ96_ROMCU